MAYSRGNSNLQIHSPAYLGSHPKAKSVRRRVLAMGTALAVLSGAGAVRAQGQTEEPSVSLQLVHPAGGENPGPPITLTLRDALERAQKYDAAFSSAMTDAKLAHEDRNQARAALLPTTSFTTQELLTKGNGVLPSGRFVTNDGIHVYRAWGVLHEDLSPNTYLMTGYRRATAAEALAHAKAEIARRGLRVTVTKDFYAVIVAQRKYSTAQQALDQAKRVLAISRDLEQGGEVAHSDVIKSEIQFEQQKQAFQEAELAMDNTRLSLAVLVSPSLNGNITAVDDLSSAQDLPPFNDARAMAERENPDLRAALEAMRQASSDVAAARGSFLPSLSIDVDYGIEANAFALRSVVSADPKDGVLPNLGHFITANLTLPLWDWGTLRSKLHQAEFKRQQARVDLSQTQRMVLSNLYTYYNEATAARAEQQELHHVAELAAESLRLITLRYQAGESTMVELVDAQNTLTQARNADDDGQLRYRVALANLQTLTGNF
jgi:outer membrane protein TolC